MQSEEFLWRLRVSRDMSLSKMVSRLSCIYLRLSFHSKQRQNDVPMKLD